MSDLDPTYDVADFIEGSRRRTVGTAIDSLPDDPQQAARAYELGRATGEKPALVYTDVEGFEANHKAALTSNLLNSNAWLREYINEDPMRAKLSADDWGQLDEVTTKLEEFRRYSGFPTRVAGSAFDKAIEGFRKGFGEGPIGSWVMDAKGIEGNRAAQAIWAASATPIEAVFRTLSGGIHGATDATYSLVKDLTGSEKLARDLAAAAEQQLSGTGVHGVMGPATGPLKNRNLVVGAAELPKPKPEPFDPQKVLDKIESDPYAQALARAKLWIDSGLEPPKGLHPEIDKIKERQNDLDVERLEASTKAAEASVTRERDPQSFADLVRMRDRGVIEIDGEAVHRLYGEKPPGAEDGLLGWVPRIGEQLELARTTGGDVSIPIAEWLAHADGDLMKLLRDDIRVRPGGITRNEAKASRGADGEEINALRDESAADLAKRTSEGVEEGAAPTTQEQGRAGLAREGGEAAKSEPNSYTITETIGGEDSTNVRLITRDNGTAIQTADGQMIDVSAMAKAGIAPEEMISRSLGSPKSVVTKSATDPVVAEYLKNQRKREIIPDDLPSVRAAAGLEPLFSIGDRKLRIERRGIGTEKPGLEHAFGSDEWRLIDENGQKVGWLEIVPYDGGKRLYIDNVGGFESKGYGPSSFGPSLMRDLLRQIKEQYPQAEQLGGYRISGAREKAGAEKEAWIKLDVTPEGWGVIEGDVRAILEGGEWRTRGMGVDAYIKPEFSDKARPIAEAVLDELDRIVPKQVGVEVVESLRRPSQGVGPGRIGGVYTQFLESFPRIMIALDKGDSVGIARHEAIHHLRAYGFFKGNEWLTLERAAREQGWIEKYGIEERYSKLDNAKKLEEAIADGYRNWAEGQPMPEAAATIFQKLKEFIERIHDRIREIIGKDFTWEELFEKVDRGEIGSREGGKPLDERAYRESIDEPTQPPPLFRTPGTIGMTERQATLYARRLREMHDSDVAYETGKAEREAKKRLTAEWKTEKKNVTAEVDADFNARPDVAADLYFARGELFGEKVERFKIDPEDLKAMGVDSKALPRDYLAKPGADTIALDDLASILGYPTGKALVLDLAKYNEAKLAANMSAKAFRDRLVSMEVERRMTQRHGDLEENIRDAAMDQVAGETQLNLLAEETLAYGIRAGLEASINKAELREAMKEKFEELPMAGESSEKYLRSMGKANTNINIADLKGRWDESYRAAQQKMNAQVMMGHARQLEKEQKAFAKLTKRLGKREVKGLDQEFHDWINTLMWQANVPSRRSLMEIQRSQAISGAEGFPEFIDRVVGDGWAPEVGSEILAGRVKPFEQMTVGEFRDFKDAIDSLNYIGRQVDKINIAGEKRDFAAYRGEVIDNISTRPQRPRESQEKGIAHRIFQADAELTRVENWLKELDLGEEMGPLVNTVIRPMADAKHKEYSLQEQLSKDIKALPSDKAWKRTLKESIPNDWFIDPSTGEPFKLTRSDLLNLMLNHGNRSNVRKLSRGYGSPDPQRSATREEADAFAGKMKDYIDQHATAQDWAFVQGVWNIYKGFQKDMEIVWRNTSGTQPKLVDPVSVDTPHGTFEGGYYPLLRDWYLSGTPKAASTRSLFGPDYPNYSTPQGHLKERTGASYFVDFRQPIGNVPLRMQQVMHDIAYRDAVMAAQKVISDKGIMAAIRQHYGGEYEKQLRPWLERIAHGASLDEKEMGIFGNIAQQTRLNLINYALPLNYVVTLTPDLGAPTPRTMYNYFGNRQQSIDIAEKWSKEIPHAIYNMDRDFREAMQRAVSEGRIESGKQKAVQWGYGIVSSISREFRRATFIDKFNKALEEGHDEAKAAAIADSYVRERHSSAAMADLPPIMAKGEGWRWITMFYGYWNTMLNWTRTIPSDVKRGEYMKALESAYGTLIIGSVFGAFIANPAKEEDSYTKRLVKAVPLQVLGMFPYIREATTYFAEGIPPRTQMGSAIQSVGAAVSDIKKAYRNEPVKKGVQHAFAVAGLVGGVPGTLQLGRTAQGLFDVYRGVQRPRDIYEWTRLMATGEARLKRQGER